MPECAEPTDRRAQRSAFASQALSLQLQCVAARHGLEMIVLADRGGNLWAASATGDHAEQLAAAAPRLPSAPAKRSAQNARRAGHRARVRALRVGEAELFLAAQGARSARGLREAAPGVARILSALV